MNRVKKERRSKQRFTTNRRMIYRIVNERKDTGWHQGEVIDMSATGLQFKSAHPVLPGHRIDLVMDWPGIYHRRPGVRLFLSGIVCRGGAHGTALRITNHDFRFAAAKRRAVA